MVELSRGAVGAELVDAVLKGFGALGELPGCGEPRPPFNLAQGASAEALPETLSRLDPPLRIAVHAYQGVSSRLSTPPEVRVE